MKNISLLKERRSLEVVTSAASEKATNAQAEALVIRFPDDEDE